MAERDDGGKAQGKPSANPPAPRRAHLTRFPELLQHVLRGLDDDECETLRFANVSPRAFQEFYDALDGRAHVTYYNPVNRLLQVMMPDPALEAVMAASVNGLRKQGEEMGLAPREVRRIGSSRPAAAEEEPDEAAKESGGFRKRRAEILKQRDEVAEGLDDPEERGEFLKETDGILNKADKLHKETEKVLKKRDEIRKETDEVSRRIKEREERVRKRNDIKEHNERIRECDGRIKELGQLVAGFGGAEEDSRRPGKLLTERRDEGLEGREKRIKELERLVAERDDE